MASGYSGYGQQQQPPRPGNFPPPPAAMTGQPSQPHQYPHGGTGPFQRPPGMMTGPPPPAAPSGTPFQPTPQFGQPSATVQGVAVPPFSAVPQRSSQPATSISQPSPPIGMQRVQQGMAGMNLGAPPKPSFGPGAVGFQQPPNGAPPTNPQGPPRFQSQPQQQLQPGFGFQNPPPIGQHQPPTPQAGTTFYSAQPPPPGGMMRTSSPTVAPQIMHPPIPTGASAPGMMSAPPAMANMIPGAPPIPAAAGGSEYFEENIDYSIQCPPRILRLASQYIPATASLAHGCKVPLGAVIRPLAPCALGEEEIKVVQPGAAGIIRCKRCRTYINAFVTWLENGRCWRCNICAQRNECPAPYFCHLDEQGQRRDRVQRPELSEGVVEFIAPSEYMVRPPQPPSYFFVIDVSVTSVRSGVLKSVASAISRSLDELPGSSRTQVGFITYDDSVHYYSFKSGLANPQMLVVADLVELFVPAPDDLLVNLQESRELVDAFLENLPNMFSNTAVHSACLGPALKAAFTVTKHIGGKMCVFQSVLPTLGDGALAPRENHQLMGTPDEVKLLRPALAWYKDTAVEFSRAQISMDMFLFPRAYIDVASLSDLPKITSGTLHTYPGFDYESDGAYFESELCRVLTQNTAFEAVMRIRCTRGMRISNFYGNFFVRGTDLLALPNCNADATFAFDLVHDEQSLSSSFVTVQSALLYTSSEGERRIRVVTQAIPVSNLASEVIQSVDVDTLTTLIAKQGLDIAMKTNLDNARGKLQQICVDLIRASREGDKPRTVSGYAAPPPMQQHPISEDEKKPIPDNLKLLPLYTLALMKNVALRGGTDVHPDERVHVMHRLTNMWVTESKHFVYPRMFSLHDMSPNAGLPSKIGPADRSDDRLIGRSNTELPRLLNLTVDRLSSNGIFLLDNGLDMFLWVGRSSDPALLNSLFGTNSLEGIDMSQLKLQRSGNDFASRLNAIISVLREDDMPQSVVAKIVIVREGDHALESRFFWHMVEDSASFNGGTFSYADFMEFVNRPPGAQGGAPGMPPGIGRGPPGQLPPSTQRGSIPPPAGTNVVVPPPGKQLQMQGPLPPQRPPGQPGQIIHQGPPPSQRPSGPSQQVNQPLPPVPGQYNSQPGLNGTMNPHQYRGPPSSTAMGAPPSISQIQMNQPIQHGPPLGPPPPMASTQQIPPQGSIPGLKNVAPPPPLSAPGGYNASSGQNQLHHRPPPPPRPNMPQQQQHPRG